MHLNDALAQAFGERDTMDGVLDEKEYLSSRLPTVANVL
jgi:hypothetical protein